ncbi:type 1 glutamine amidotransferase [Kiloniella sp. b19]|uniref:type 1 glutamine amidotransferase n=1 Tax=Kiloniella sp. GXU_MW_B19 TaxID=3141326 RepID=UPI0031CF2DB1
MKLGILQNGQPADEMVPTHGQTHGLFRKFLENRGFTFVSYNVEACELPESPLEADGWLLTGSRHGVYEDHAFIPLLEDFIRKTYAAAVPMVGICFGHQIMAQALGGRVEKFSGGWSVGPTKYDLPNPSPLTEHLKSDSITVLAYHQDQVLEKPEGSTVIASSDFCRIAGLQYGDRALTLQPHPEFTKGFVTDLANLRRNILPEEIYDGAMSRMDASVLSSSSIGDVIERFFKER